MKKIGAVVFVIGVFLFNFVSYGGEDTEGVIEKIISDSDMYEYVEELDMQLEHGGSKSVEEMCKELVGNKDYGFTGFFSDLLKGITIDFKDYKSLMMDILFLGFSAALFSLVTMAFSKSHVGEYGFYAAYTMMFIVIVGAFAKAAELAVVLIKNVTTFMKVVAPAFSLAVVCSGESTYGAGIGQLMLIMCAVVGMVFINLLVGGIKFYLVLGMSNSMLSVDKFSHLSDMVGKGVGWIMRSVFVFFCGVSILQKMFWPAFDSIKNTVAIKTMSVIPVVGTTMNAAGQTVLGAFMVLKSSIGTLAVLFLVSISVVPIVKVFLYYLALSAVSVIIQPVCDKRLIKSIKVATKAMGLLVGLMLVVTGLFIITLAIATG